MAKKGENRELVTLQCTECKNENYRTQKNKRNTTERLELNKYCNHCKKALLEDPHTSVPNGRPATQNPLPRSYTKENDVSSPPVPALQWPHSPHPRHK